MKTRIHFCCDHCDGRFNRIRFFLCNGYRCLFRLTLLSTSLSPQTEIFNFLIFFFQKFSYRNQSNRSIDSINRRPNRTSLILTQHRSTFPLKRISLELLPSMKRSSQESRMRHISGIRRPLQMCYTRADTLFIKAEEFENL